MQNFKLQVEMFIRCTTAIENCLEHAKFPVNGKYVPIKLSTLTQSLGESRWEAPRTFAHTVHFFTASTLKPPFL